MDEKPKTIMTGFAPLDFLVTLVMPSISDPIIETWDNVVYELAEKAKNKGLRGIDDFLLTIGYQEDRHKYNTTQISQEILNKLLNGEIKTLKELRQNKTNNSTSNYNGYILFHYEKDDEYDKDKKLTIIDAIFINNV